MTTTEFIKLIKDYQSDRKRLYASHWNYTDPVCIVSVNELEKIEKVNVELLEACQATIRIKDLWLYNEKDTLPEYEGEAQAVSKLESILNKAIKNASNIKQI